MMKTKKMLEGLFYSLDYECLFMIRQAKDEDELPLATSINYLLVVGEFLNKVPKAPAEYAQKRTVSGSK